MAIGIMAPGLGLGPSKKILIVTISKPTFYQILSHLCTLADS